MPSGKQILLDFLLDLSTRTDLSPDDDDDLRAALIHHVSTSRESLDMVEAIGWRSKFDGDDVVARGIATAESAVLLSDLLETLIETPEMPERVGKRFPNLSPSEFEHAKYCLWYLISALQWFQELGPVETPLAKTERTIWIENGRKILENFRTDPW